MNKKDFAFLYRKMNTIIRKNSPFLIPFVLLWSALAFVLALYTKSEIHLFLNQFHSGFFDLFFRLITHLGDGLFLTFVAVFYLFISFRRALTLGLAGILTALFIQLLKRGVYDQALRPKAYFEGLSSLYLVPGVEVHEYYSFPSGHTATAFCLFFLLAVFISHKSAQVLLFLTFILVAYSRVYLSQHFLVDIYFGALTGLITAFLGISILNKAKWPWLDQSILSLIRKP